VPFPTFLSPWVLSAVFGSDRIMHTWESIIDKYLNDGWITFYLFHSTY
jgi:hypothetical protein